MTTSQLDTERSRGWRGGRGVLPLVWQAGHSGRCEGDSGPASASRCPRCQRYETPAKGRRHYICLHVYVKSSPRSRSVLTSAPRRLSEHILQKESRACRKAGDNFLWDHKQHEKRSQSPRVCMCSTASGSPDLWLTDWGFDRGHPASIKHIAARLPLTLSCNSEGWI